METAPITKEREMNFAAGSTRSLHDRAPLGADAHRGAVRPESVAREEWIRACANRLAELCFHNDRDWMLHLAGELWDEVSGFDPVMAAELEHESWLVDN